MFGFKQHRIFINNRQKNVTFETRGITTPCFFKDLVELCLTPEPFILLNSLHHIY